MTLSDRAAGDPLVGSSELADHHLKRLLGRASTDRIAERAAEIARIWSTAGLVLAGVSLAAVVIDPFRVVEGLDVLAASDGRAPLRLTWLDDFDMVAKAPEYLHRSDEAIVPFESASLPRGATVTVRGRPIHAGRALVLTDGHAEVPFVDDGSSGVVARWTVGDSSRLFVAARFGSVLVPQIDEQPIESIPDLAPTVIVEGAPRTIKLIEEPDVSIHYEASDDHGLREVDLVLRSGTKEERRGLSRPQADAKLDRGGYELRSKDPFIRRASGPIEVTVEARDNDPIAGPKWGKSAPLILVPPDIGEPEALRYEGLVRARDAMTDLLADRLLQKAPAKATAKEHGAHEAEIQASAKRSIAAAVQAEYGGLRIRGRAVSVVLGQLRRLDKALGAENTTPSDKTHQTLLAETESVLLTLDNGARALASHDARSVAKRLADVADDGAAAASSFGASSTDLVVPTAKLDASVHLLDGGGKQLLRLGDLGVDLGEIVVNDLRRVARARAAKDMFHAELALRDLAARLRHPEPSFAGGGGHGTESGGGSPSPSDTPSEGDDQSGALAQELEQLVNDHSGEVGDVEDALEKAASPEELEALKQEAKEHADAIREAIKNLPRRSNDPGTAESAAAEGREQAEAMAGALERGQPGSASDSGKNSMRALGEAKRIGEQSGGFFPEERAGREAAKARETIERELAWAERARERLRKGASDRAKGALEKSGEEEGKLSERARKLGEKGESGDATLPQETLDHLSEAEQAMREAKKALKAGDGEAGLERQKHAQRMLEMAKESMTEEAEESEGESRTGDARGRVSTQKQEIPGKDKHKGPDEFRRRVIEGLGGPSDPLLKPAVKRYAEGLLR
jgi:hypothetical protein